METHDLQTSKCKNIVILMTYKLQNIKNIVILMTYVRCPQKSKHFLYICIQITYNIHMNVIITYSYNIYMK